MSETPKRFTLRGRIHSPQELRLAKDREDYAREVARLPGEGLHEYVRRVGLGDYQLIRTTELNSINDENSRLRRELDVARNLLRANPSIGSSETATQSRIRREDEMRSSRRALMEPPSRVLRSLREDLRGLAVDVEERLMVGGILNGQIMEHRASDDHYEAREMEHLDISDLRDSALRRMTTREFRSTYVLFRLTNNIPMMIVQELLNSPRSVQDAHVNRAMRMAGLDT